MEQCGEAQSHTRLGPEFMDKSFDQETVLGDGECVVALGLTIPACDARQAMRDIFDLDIEGRRVEQIETAAAEHSLPGTAVIAGRHRFASNALRGL
jgi:hypothetical protein